MRTCTKCKHIQPVEQFVPLKSKPGKFHCWCRGCLLRSSNDWKKKKKTELGPVEWSKRNKNSSLWNKYKITLGDYLKLLEGQGFRCKICGTDTPAGATNTFAVDHDHLTGKVRGLLCDKCNMGLGMFKESSAVLLTAAQYLLGN